MWFAFTPNLKVVENEIRLMTYEIGWTHCDWSNSFSNPASLYLAPPPRQVNGSLKGYQQLPPISSLLHIAPPPLVVTT